MIFIIKYGEIFLKSEFVKRRFEKILVDNIRCELKKKKIEAKVWRALSHILLESSNSEKVEEILSHTFGIVSFSPATICKKDMNEIKECAKNLANFPKGSSFAIVAKRSDKLFNYNSQAIKEIVGKEISSLGYKVNLDKPDNKIFIEVRERCFLYSKVFHGPGGLPLGASGSAIGKLKTEKDLLANFLMMKRGMNIILIGKVNPAMLERLERWSIGRGIRKINKLSDAKTKIIIGTKDEVRKNYLILNPLSGFSEKEIEAMLKKI